MPCEGCLFVFKSLLLRNGLIATSATDTSNYLHFNLWGVIVDNDNSFHNIFPYSTQEIVEGFLKIGLDKQRNRKLWYFKMHEWCRTFVDRNKMVGIHRHRRKPICWTLSIIFFLTVNGKFVFIFTRVLSSLCILHSFILCVNKCYRFLMLMITLEFINSIFPQKLLELFKTSYIYLYRKHIWNTKSEKKGRHIQLFNCEYILSWSIT